MNSYKLVNARTQHLILHRACSLTWSDSHRREPGYVRLVCLVFTTLETLKSHCFHSCAYTSTKARRKTKTTPFVYGEVQLQTIRAHSLGRRLLSNKPQENVSYHSSSYNQCREKVKYPSLHNLWSSSSVS